MNVTESHGQRRGAVMRIPRSRGATSGVLLLLAGLWGALVPLFGHVFGFAYAQDAGWRWTAATGWLEVLPGLATVLGGALLVLSRNRATALLGGWLATVAGAWFVVGRALASPLKINEIGSPVAQSAAERAALDLAYFSGIGALIVFLGAIALGRLSVRSMRDIQYAQGPAPDLAERRTDRTDVVEDGEARDSEPAVDRERAHTGSAGWRRLLNWRHSSAHQDHAEANSVGSASR